MDWLDLLAVQGILKSPLQHHSSKASTSEWVSVSSSVVPDFLWPHGLQPARLLSLWNSPGKNTGVACHALLQEIFPTRGSNPGLLNCRQILYQLRHQEKVFLASTATAAKSLQSCPTLCDPIDGSPRRSAVSIVSISICHEVKGPDAMIFVFWMLSFKPTFSLSSFNLKRLFSS